MSSAGLQVPTGGVVDASGLPSSRSSGAAPSCGERTDRPASVARGTTVDFLHGYISSL